MPILKPTGQGSKAAVYHTVTSVEFFRRAGVLAWRGAYRSFKDVGGTTPSVAMGVVEGVPVTDFSADPIEAFEKACIANPDNVFFGGDYVAPGEVTGGVQVERLRAWARVKAGRDAYLEGGVDTPFGRFDSDLNTLVNALGAVATMVAGSTRGWIMEDHTPVLLTLAQVLELGACLSDLRDRGYAQGSALYAQIQAAPTVEDVRAIAWTPPA